MLSVWVRVTPLISLVLTPTVWFISCVIGVPSVLGPSDFQVLLDHLRKSHPKCWDKRPAGHD